MYSDYTFIASQPNNDASAILAAFAGFFLLLLVVSLATYVLKSIGTMLLFKKAGHTDKHYLAWIPYFDVVPKVLIGGKDLNFLIYPALVMLGMCIPFVNFLVAFALLGIILYIEYIFIIKFGKSGAWLILLVICPPAYAVAVFIWGISENTKIIE